MQQKKVYCMTKKSALSAYHLVFDALDKEDGEFLGQLCHTQQTRRDLSKDRMAREELGLHLSAYQDR